jgi:hypothetical protein
MFIEHPPENLMASFDFTNAVLNEGTIFIFGSWIYITNGSGGFNSHLANSRELEIPVELNATISMSSSTISMRCCSLT